MLESRLDVLFGATLTCMHYVEGDVPLADHGHEDHLCISRPLSKPKVVKIPSHPFTPSIHLSTHKKKHARKADCDIRVPHFIFQEFIGQSIRGMIRWLGCASTAPTSTQASSVTTSCVLTHDLGHASHYVIQALLHLFVYGKLPVVLGGRIMEFNECEER